MNAYETEEDQVEALKQWWKENARAVIFGLVVGVGGVVGWQYWQGQQATQALDASNQYESLLQQMEAGQYEQVVVQAQQLRADFADTPYAALSGLQEAKAQMEQNNRQAAIDVLRQTHQLAKNDGVKQVALLRALRLQLAAGQAQQVVDQLQTIDAGQFAGQYQELKGDALVQLGSLQKARTAYLLALNSITTDRRLLQIKLNDLAVAAPQESQQ